MKLSLVFELLLIFVLLAFAASKNIRKQKNHRKGIQSKNDDGIIIEDNGINKYCKCSEAYCNCCRDFQLPIVNLDGPGCASLMYLNGDKMSVSLSFGKKVITNRTLSGKKPSPVCMPLPGGISKFCGRVYNIARAGEEFRACLGLELQSKSTVEAAVRVSCFKFGPRGVTSEPADPLPLVPQTQKDDEDDDDDDDDDDDIDFDLDDDDDDLSAVNEVEGADYTGFSLLGEDLLGDLFESGGNKNPNKNKNKKKQAPVSTTTTTTRKPRPSRRPTRKPATRTTTTRPIRTTSVRVRPTSDKPSRRPSRRPLRRTTTASTPLAGSSVSEILSNIVSPTASTATGTPEKIELIYAPNASIKKPVSPQKANQQPKKTTTMKPVTNFDDPGIHMSLMSITGQLWEVPVTAIMPSKDASVMTTAEDSPTYEKIQTITPKPMSTIAMSISSEERGSESSEDPVQIVDSLDSSSLEQSTESIAAVGDGSRGHKYQVPLVIPVPNNYYEGLSLNKNKGGSDYGDYDVLGLTAMGETIGENLGIFNNKRQNKNLHEHKRNKEDDDDFLGLSVISDTLGLSDYDSNRRSSRRRQNKMMRGEWSASHV